MDRQNTSSRLSHFFAAELTVELWYTKRVRLSAISHHQRFALLGLDQISQIADQMHLQINVEDDNLLLELFLQDLAELYSSEATGVVFSPEIGYEALHSKTEGAGPLFCLERQTSEHDPLSVPILVPRWGVEAIRNNYGVAKLQLIYNPTEAEAATKRQMVAELYDYCQHEGIDFLLDLVIYVEGTEKEYKQIFQQLQLQAIQQLRNYCDLMALEYPLDTIGAVTVTAELDVPWILSARDTAYEDLKDQLRNCLESGASGFMAIQQFLPSLATHQKFDRLNVKEFLKTTGRDRVIELRRIVDEAATGVEESGDQAGQVTFVE